MKQIFIVNDEQNGAKVVSESVLAADIRKELKQRNITDYRRCDVESLAKDVVMDYVGKSVSIEKYQEMIDLFINVIVTFHTITPYIFMKDYFSYSENSVHVYSGE